MQVNNSVANQNIPHAFPREFICRVPDIEKQVIHVPGTAKGFTHDGNLYIGWIEFAFINSKHSIILSKEG